MALQHPALCLLALRFLLRSCLRHLVSTCVVPTACMLFDYLLIGRQAGHCLDSSRGSGGHELLLTHYRLSSYLWLIGWWGCQVKAAALAQVNTIGSQLDAMETETLSAFEK